MTQPMDVLHREIGSDFVGEGIMLALPLCFPTQSDPPPAGQTAASVMLPGRHRSLLLGTCGEQARVLVGKFHRDAGAVRDLGPVPDAIAVNGISQLQLPQPDSLTPSTGVIASGESAATLWRVHARIAGFLIQEWSCFTPCEYEFALKLFDDTAVIHAVATDEPASMVGLTRDGRVFRLDIAEPRMTVIGQVAGPIPDFSRIIHVGGRRSVFADAAGMLWRVDAQAGELVHTGLRLPETSSPPCVAFAWDDHTDTLYAGLDPEGILLAVDLASQSLRNLGRVSHLAGLGCLTVGRDGRIFGMAGTPDDIGHLFDYQPTTGEIRNLGVPVSALSERQYGYHFRCALTGKDGEIYFGQHERVNHVWMYFPAIAPRE